LMHVKTRFLHLVDFGNHRPTPGPFDGLYDVPIATAQTRRRDINLLRAPDLLKAFEESGVATTQVPYAFAAPDEMCSLHADWSTRYDPATLALKTAIFASRV